MTDLNLIYSGGSGGFFLLHLLFLSGQYTAALDQGISIKDAVAQQWQIPELKDWKSSEIWPHNKTTQKLNTDLNKIYFYCSPNLEIINKNIKTVTIYTDIQSQKLLAFHKRANWYLGRNHLPSDLKFADYLQMLRSWRRHYNAVKDPSWPRCVSFRHIDRLPEYIQTELKENPYVQDFLNYQYNKTDTVIYQGIRIHKEAQQYINFADTAILLQDIVNSRGQVLVDALNIPPVNDQQREFIDRWTNLHPPALLQQLGIKAKYW